ncbi:MAG: hypothetical protein P8N76_12480 [Pirellulaceae bacterium]|nr:hypothetical protein [Pirellulaceae bacterium]
MSDDWGGIHGLANPKPFFLLFQSVEKANFSLAHFNFFDAL